MPESASYTTRIPVKTLLEGTVELYQQERAVSARVWAAKRKGQFQERFCPSLTVAVLPDETYVVLDGLGRLNLASLDMGNAYEISCQVLVGLDYKERAATFVVLDRERRNITVMQRFVALREAADPETLQIIEILDRCGVTLEGKTRTTTNYTSVVYVQRTFKLGPDFLEQALVTIQDAMKDHDDATDGGLLFAVASVIRAGNSRGGPVDPKRLRHALSADVITLTRLGAERGMGRRGTKGFVREEAIRAGIITKYNSNLKRNSGGIAPLTEPWVDNKFVDTPA